MEQLKIKRYLEMASSVAVLIVSMMVIGTLAQNYFVRDSIPRLRPGLEKGQRLNRVEGVVYKDSPRTLLVAMSAQCRFCEESVTFYKRLAEEQSKQGDAVHFVAVFTDSEDEVKKYLQEKQLGVDYVADADLNSLSISATPSLVLADSDGKILDFWIGKLSENDERQVLKTVLETPAGSTLE